jgi:hypothetical protein
MFAHQRQGEPPHVAVKPGWRVTVESQMNKTALLFGVGASLILAAGTASAAGSCGAEVAELQQKIGMEETTNATIGATDPGVQQPSPSASVDSSTTTGTSGDTTATGTNTADAGTADGDNDANATIGASDPGVQQPQPEANATTGTSTTTDGTTTSEDTNTNVTIGANDPGVQQPQDMDSTDDADASASSSTTTMPSGSVEETSRVGDLNTAAGGHAEAITALKKAQLAADAGDETACMTELGTAKSALGIQ